MSFKVHGTAPTLWHQTIRHEATANRHEATARTFPQNQQTISTIAATAFAAIKEDNKISPILDMIMHLPKMTLKIYTPYLRNWEKTRFHSSTYSLEACHDCVKIKALCSSDKK
jgi:hypothetical protein